MKKIVCLFVTVLIAVNSISVISFADFGETLNYAEIPQYESSMEDALNFEHEINKAEFLTKVEKALQNFDSEIDLTSYGFSSADAETLFSFIMYSLPEVFNIKPTFRFYTSGNSKITRIIPQYNCTKPEYQKMLNLFYEKADNFLSGIKDNADLTDYQKALILHDRLIDKIDYTLEGTFTHTAYGAMVDGRAVCQGYTLAYSYLLNVIGIENYACSSIALNHIWNIVNIDGEYYHVDLTWDDPTNCFSGTASHTNFLVSTDKLKATHNATDYDTIPNSTRFDNYFWNNSKDVFQLIGGNIYFYDNTDHNIKKWTYNGDISVLTNVNSFWFIPPSQRYTGCSKISSDGYDLFFSTNNQIKKYNLKTNSISVAYEPEITEKYNWIYGFTYDDGKFIYEISDEPNFDSTTNNKYDYQHIYTYTSPDSAIGYKDGVLSYLHNGEVYSSFTGMANYKNNLYYVVNGIVDVSPDKIVLSGGMLYHISNGLVNSNEGEKILDYNGNKYYFTDGVNEPETKIFTYNGITYYIENGVVDNSLNKIVSVGGTLYHVSNGIIDKNEPACLLDFGDGNYYFEGGVNVKKTLVFSQDGIKYYVHGGMLLEDGNIYFVNYNGHYYISENSVIITDEEWSFINNDTYFHLKNGIATYDITRGDSAGMLASVVNMILGIEDIDYLYDFSRDEDLNILDLVSAKKELSSIY